MKKKQKKEAVEPVRLVDKWWLQGGFCPSCHSGLHKAIPTAHIAKAYECLSCGEQWEEVY
jgi:hypothetical protein